MGVATADELSRQKEQLMRTEQVNVCANWEQLHRPWYHIWAPSHHCFAEVGWYQLNLEKQWETHPGDRHLIWVWKLKKKCKTIFRESAVCLELLETTLGVIVIFLNPMTISHFYPILKCRQVISSSPSCNHWTNETWFTARVRQTLLEMSQCWTMLLLVIPEHQLRIKLVGTLSLLQYNNW